MASFMAADALQIINDMEADLTAVGPESAQAIGAAKAAVAAGKLQDL